MNHSWPNKSYSSFSYVTNIIDFRFICITNYLHAHNNETIVQCSEANDVITGHYRQQPFHFSLEASLLCAGAAGAKIICIQRNGRTIKHQPLHSQTTGTDSQQLFCFVVGRLKVWVTAMTFGLLARLGDGVEYSSSAILFVRSPSRSRYLLLNLGDCSMDCVLITACNRSQCLWFVCTDFAISLYLAKD